MTKNLGSVDRGLRVLAALVFGACAVAAPFGLGVRLGVFGLNAAYLLWSALAGSCVGYRLMGRSSCSGPAHS
jgi:purine-cytosine permease-like protein